MDSHQCYKSSKLLNKDVSLLDPVHPVSDALSIYI